MTPLDLDDLPRHSEWAAYLLDPTGDPPGNPAAYTSTDIYEIQHARLLEAYRENPTDPATFERAVRTEHRPDPGPISIGGELFLASPAELVERERTTVREALEPVVVESATVVDLGCGWGRALRTIADAFTGTDLVGGEYGASGVALARELTAGRDRIVFERFDFTAGYRPDRAVDGAIDAGADDPSDAVFGGVPEAASDGVPEAAPSDPSADAPMGWELFDSIDGETVVFTRGALTTLDDVGSVVDQFAALAADGDLTGGVHLEQVDVHPDTALGHLRRRYGRVRGYDDSLLHELESREDLVVTDVAYDVVGANPLHPLTRIRWEPA